MADLSLEELRREVAALRVLVDFFAKTVGGHFAVNYYPDFSGELAKAVAESERIRAGE